MSDESGDSTIVDFRSAAPSMRIKPREVGDHRAFCKHKQIEVWAAEPIITCSSCGATVDPFSWLRDRCRDWQQLRDTALYQVEEAKREMAELKTAIRLLRKEYADEAEKSHVERQLMVLPPRKRI